jgi:TonB family protein
MSDYRHDIEKYLKGELSPAERNALERKAMHDPFLADALEGAEQIRAEDFSEDVAALQLRIANKKTASVWMWTARIAAGLALIAISTFLITTVMLPKSAKNLAFEKTTPAPPNTSDSLSPSGEISTAAVEHTRPSLAAGPVARDKDIASQSKNRQKSDSKPPQVEAAKPDNVKGEPASGVAAASEEPIKVSEPKTDQVAATESLALEVQKETERGKAMADDDVADKKLAQRSLNLKRKDVAAKEEAPAALHYQNADALSSKPNIVSGRVTSSEDGTPLPGVNVVIKGTANGTSTDADGYYQLDASNGNALVYSYIGLESKEIALADQKNIDINLALDVAQLSEVVVTAGGLSVQQHELGNQATPTFEVTHPENGMITYRQYLTDSIRYPAQARANKIQGRVTIQFTVEANGSLTDFIILKGIGNGCDEESIRLIKEGPRWIPTKMNGTAVKDNAKIRLNFKLPK